jgi:hypothetical protein
LFSSSGGIGISSNWVTEAAPCRLEVPTQSEPVSPPPMTTTCLPRTLIGLSLPTRTSLFCGIRNSSAAWMPFSSRPGNRQLARHFGTGGQDHGVECCGQLLRGDEFARIVVDAGRKLLAADDDPRLEGDAFGFHLAMRRSTTDFSSLKSGMP